MAAPTSAELGALMGRTVTTEQGNAVLSIISALASGYTRGVGFTDGVPNNEIRAVVLSAACRYIAEPRQMATTEVVGPMSARFEAGGFDFSVGERMVLNRYRIRAL